MHIAAIILKPLSGIQMSADEKKILSWLKSAKWEPETNAREPIPYKTKVPEFFSGVRLYQMQASGGAGAAQGALGLFIKKLEYQGIISKQDLYPVVVQNNARFLSLREADLENLGVGQEEEEE